MKLWKPSPEDLIDANELDLGRWVKNVNIPPLSGHQHVLKARAGKTPSTL